jgi:hypothetical protein
MMDSTFTNELSSASLGSGRINEAFHSGNEKAFTSFLVKKCLLPREI